MKYIDGPTLLVMQLCCLIGLAVTETVKFWPEEPRFVLFSIAAGSNLSPSHEYLEGKSSHWDVSYKDLPRNFRSSMLDRINSYVDKFGVSKFVVEMRTGGKKVAAAEFRIPDKDQVQLYNWFQAQNLVATYPFWIAKIPFVDFSISGSGNGAANRRSFYMHAGPHKSCHEEFGLMGASESVTDSCSWARGSSNLPVLYYAQKNGPYNSTVAYAEQLIVYIE